MSGKGFGPTFCDRAEAAPNCARGHWGPDVQGGASQSAPATWCQQAPQLVAKLVPGVLTGQWPSWQHIPARPLPEAGSSSNMATRPHSCSTLCARPGSTFNECACRGVEGTEGVPGTFTGSCSAREAGGNGSVLVVPTGVEHPVHSRPLPHRGAGKDLQHSGGCIVGYSSQHSSTFFGFCVCMCCHVAQLPGCPTFSLLCWAAHHMQQAAGSFTLAGLPRLPQAEAPVQSLSAAGSMNAAGLLLAAAWQQDAHLQPAAAGCMNHDWHLPFDHQAQLCMSA